VLLGAQGERRVAAGDFFDQPLMTTIAAGELITEVRVPAGQAPAGCAVVEFARRHADFAIAGAAVARWGNGGGRAAIALFGVGPAPVRARAAEGLLTGSESNSASEVAAAAAAELSPSGDIHGSAEYRRRLAAVCVERALAAAWEQTP